MFTSTILLHEHVLLHLFVFLVLIKHIPGRVLLRLDLIRRTLINYFLKRLIQFIKVVVVQFRRGSCRVNDLLISIKAIAFRIALLVVVPIDPALSLDPGTATGRFEVARNQQGRPGWIE